jgi:hypothetical protein
MNEASSCFSDLIKIGYPKEEIDKKNKELSLLLNKSHRRLSGSLALIGIYTEKLLKLAGENAEEFWDVFIKEVIDLNENMESGKTSLNDFLDNLIILLKENKIGFWCMNLHKDTDKKEYLGIHMRTVWDVYQKAFTPNYDKTIINELIKSVGGKDRADVYIPYKTKDDFYKRIIQPKKKPFAKCHIIPKDAIENFDEIESFLADPDPSNSHESQNASNGHRKIDNFQIVL